MSVTKSILALIYEVRLMCEKSFLQILLCDGFIQFCLPGRI